MAVKWRLRVERSAMPLRQGHPGAIRFLID